MKHSALPVQPLGGKFVATAAMSGVHQRLREHVRQAPVAVGLTGGIASKTA
jgi:hypothetical protein